MDLIVRRGPLDGREGLWDIGIAAGRIVAVAAGIPDRASVELDAAENLVAPSFVDLHTHLDKALTASRGARPGRARTLDAIIQELRSQRDPFVRHGNADMLAAMLLLAQLLGMRSDDELRAVWAMATVNGARALRRDDDYGVAPGCRADLVLFDEPAVPEAILHQTRRRYVVKAGRVVAAEERLLAPAAPTDAG